MSRSPYQEQLLRAALSVVRTPRAKRSGFRRDNPWPPPRSTAPRARLPPPASVSGASRALRARLGTRVCMLNCLPGRSGALEPCSQLPSLEGEGGRADWGSLEQRRSPQGGRESRGCPQCRAQRAQGGARHPGSPWLL